MRSGLRPGFCGKLSVFFLIFFVEPGVFAGEINATPLDPGMCNTSFGFQRITGGDEQSGVASGFEAAEPTLHTKDLCGVEGDGFESFIAR